MKKTTVPMILLVAFLGSSAWAQRDPIENAIEACKPEIETYCSQVTPGDGRLLACFFAHEDKLSGRCGWALYHGAAQLEQFAAAITHLAVACLDDMEKHCAQVEIGEGRVASCLLEHRQDVSKTCNQAIDDVGLEVVNEG